MGDVGTGVMAESSGERWAGRPVPTWFRDAKLGIFVHWTVGSVPAFAPVGKDPFTLAKEEGERVAFSHTPYAEWYWNSVSIPGSPAAEHHERLHGGCDYGVFAQRFLDTARGWETRRWRELFAASRARYAVMVTKHHDGVLMWPSEHPNPFRGEAWQSERDLVGEVAEVARSVGMRFGVYYSGGLDWTFEGLGIDGWRALFAAIPQSDEYHAYADTHWRELIDRYRPDVLWNDIGYPRFGEGAAALVADFYEGNPEGVVNDRFDVLGVRAGRTHADFTTPEYSTRPDDTARPFEVCRGIGTSFGYTEAEGEHSYLPIDELVRMFVGIVADGGNLLLNIGPMPGGEVPWGQQLRLLALGQWLSVNGEGVFGSRPHELAALETGEGIPVRLTRGADGATYAFVCGRPDAATVTIDGLPAGDVHLLGHDARLARHGETVVLPARPDDTPVWTIRVGEG